MAYYSYGAVYWSIAAVALFISILFLVRYFRRRNTSTTYIVKQPTVVTHTVQPAPVIQYATVTPVVQYGAPSQAVYPSAPVFV